MGRRRAFALLPPALLLGCPSLAALSPGDAGGEDAGRLDGAGDGGPVADRTAADVADGSRGDASDAPEEQACVFVDAGFVDAPGPPDAACVLYDGSACAPGYDPTYASYLTLPPPRTPHASCTSQQIQQYLTYCPIPYPLQQPSAMCQEFLTNTNNTNCVACLGASPVTAGSLGPIFYSSFGPESDVGYNYYGCVEIMDPCNAPCAQAMWRGYECPVVSCYPFCNVAELGQCGMTADHSCICSDDVAASQQCYDAFQAAGGPVTQCFVDTGVLEAFCGGL